MARTATENSIEQHIVTDEDTPGLPAMKQAVDLQAANRQMLSDGADALIAVGRIESALFFNKVSEKLIAETAIAMRDSKKYKQLPNNPDREKRKYISAFGDNSDADNVNKDSKYKEIENSPHNTKLDMISTFDEYCDVYLGKTGRQVRNLISNYNTIGSELYEQAQKMGFRQVDYNALKVLPDDDKELVLMAVESNDGDKAIELMQEMAVKHAREKQGAEQQLEEMNKDLQSKDEVIKGKDEKLNKLDLQLNRDKLDQQQNPPGHQELEDLQKLSRQIAAMVSAGMNSAYVKLSEAHHHMLPEPARLAMAQSIGLVISEAHALAEELNITPVDKADSAVEHGPKADAEDFMQWQQEQARQAHQDTPDESA